MTDQEKFKFKSILTRIDGAIEYYARNSNDNDKFCVGGKSALDLAQKWILEQFPELKEKSKP